MKTLSDLKAAELVFSALSKAIAQVLLMRRQNMHGKVICFDEYLVTQRVEPNTPQDQRRLKRHRVEAADGNANFLSLRIKRRNNADTGRKAA